MNYPDISPKHEWSEYWRPVESGLQEPDEWQQAIMNKVQEALDSGLFYTTDVRKYVMEHNDFIPAEWWSYQYSNIPVEGGIMGMELYMARSTLGKNRERAEDNIALQSLSVEQQLGTLYINAKRYLKCRITAIEGRDVTIIGSTGKNLWQFHTSPRSIRLMIERAISRGWRKP